MILGPYLAIHSLGVNIIDSETDIKLYKEKVLHSALSWLLFCNFDGVIRMF